MTTVDQSHFIELALSHHVLKFGDFTLKSGRKSPYFFNAGNFHDGTALAKLGHFYAKTIVQHDIKFDVLFGPAYKGIPLVAATAIALARDFDRDVPFAFNRKEAKDHGEGGTVVGAPLQGRVLIVDDVITAGTAFRESIELLKQHDATCAGLVLAVNRQEKGQGQHSAIHDIKTKFHIPVFSIISFTDLYEFVSQHPHYQQHLPAMRAYREQYGVDET